MKLSCHREDRKHRLAAGIVVAWLACHTLSASAGAPPEYFQKLIDAGNVQFEFYDPQVGPTPSQKERGQDGGDLPKSPAGRLQKDRRPHRGFTEFKLFVSHSYEFRYTRSRRGGGWQVTIRPDVRKVTCRLSHTVHLPKYLDSDRRWGHPLVKHEFDHVAISADLRVRMLVEHLLLNLPEFELRVPGGTLLDNKFYQSAVDQRIAERREAVIQLVEANQQRLDEITRRGARWTPDRQAFLRSLYTEGNLEQVKFPYTDDVRDLLGTDAYRKAELPHALDDKETQSKYYREQ
jgi:hypothetical protein